MQDPDHQEAKCFTCDADPYEPCRNRDGSISLKVHWGRPYWSKQKPYVLRGGNVDIKLNLEQFKVIHDLIDRGNIIEDRPVLFTGTNICADCGEPYNNPGLVSRCKKRHQRVTA